MSFDVWLDHARRRRIGVLAAILFALYFALEMLVHVTPQYYKYASGLPVGDDYVNFYAAAKLALSGKAALIYDMPGFMKFERTFGYFHQFKWYSYPPTALYFSLPFSVLPYLVSYAAWLVALPLLLVRFLTRYMSGFDAVLCVAAFPPTFYNAVAGQNGDVSALLLAYGVVLLRDRPGLAGMCFGALSFKPHLGLMIPVALAMGGYWKSFATAAVAAVAMAAISVLVFGVDAWEGFLRNAPLNSRILEDGFLPPMPGDPASHGLNFWHRTPTVFAMLRLLGCAPSIAYAAQAVVALCVAISVGLVWRSSARLEVKSATLLVGTMCATPYLWDYDMVLAMVAMALLWWDGKRFGFGPWDRWVMVAVSAGSLLLESLARAAHLQLMPAVLLVLLGVCVHRAIGQKAPVAALA